MREEIEAVAASEEAKELFANVALAVPFKRFLTTEAYPLLP